MKGLQTQQSRIVATCLQQAERRALSSQASTSFSVEEPMLDATTNDAEPLTPQAKANLQRGMVRSSLLAQTTAAQLFKGHKAVLGNRPDVLYRHEREVELLQGMKDLAPEYRARPSALMPLASAAGFCLGAASALLPDRLSTAVTGAVQEVLTEQYNDQLRELREHGLSDGSAPLRTTLRALRDEERAPDAPQAPDILKLQRPQDLTAEEWVAAGAKYGLKALLAAGSRI